MDGLSAAASGFAVVSLAIQLADGVKKLCDFWNSVKDAPEDIHGIIADLQLLLTVLTEMAVEAQHVESDSALAAVLKACNDKIHRLAGLTNDLEPGFASRRLRVRHWTAFKAVLKGDRIQKFMKELEGLKSTLLLAQQHHNGRFIRLRSQKHEQDLTAIARSLASLSLQQSSATIITQSPRLSENDSHTQAVRAEAVRMGRTMPNPVQRRGFEICSESAVQEIASGRMEDQSTKYGNSMELEAGCSSAPSPRQSWSSPPARIWKKRTLERKASAIRTIFGTISIYSITRQLRSSIDDNQNLKEEDQDPKYEYESSFKVSPAPWLLKLGFNYGYNISTSSSPYQGWTNNIQPFTLVPNDALIFRFCSLGDLAAVHSLFSRNLASVRDTNSEGLTALHIAAAYYHAELCDFLIMAGADKNARTFRSPQTPIMFAGWLPCRQGRLSDVIDTFRLLLNSLDWESDASGCGSGWDLLVNISYWDDIYLDAVMLWLIRSSNFEIQSGFHDQSIAFLLIMIKNKGITISDTIGALIKLGPGGWFNTLGNLGLSALYVMVVRQRWDEARVLLTMGADPHLLCDNLDGTSRARTPTSLAMDCSWTFWSFRNVLREANVDIDDYIESGLGQAGPLIDDGWQVETLRVLFQYDFGPDFSRRCDYGWTCKHHSSEHYSVEPWWQHILEKIKCGIDADTLSSIVSNVPRVQDSSVESHSIIASQPSDTSIRNGHELSRDLLSPGAKAAQVVSTSPAIDIDGPLGLFVCIPCWLHFKKYGHLPPGNYWSEDELEDESEADLEDELEDESESSQDEFSPFHIHT